MIGVTHAEGLTLDGSAQDAGSDPEIVVEGARSRRAASDSAFGSFLSYIFIFVLFAKAAGFIDWSWWTVTSPIWGMFVLVGGVMLLAGAFALFGFIYAWWQNRSGPRL